ncbi:MAG: YciI family protein [Curvibacter sp.]
MSYLLMMVEPVGQRRTRSEAEGREVYGRMLQFAETLRARGQLLAVESLASQEHATRVQVRAGHASLTDGPFAEAKEMVGGFFLVNCKTLEDELQLERQCPAAEWCTVEVRETAPCYEN